MNPHQLVDSDGNEFDPAAQKRFMQAGLVLLRAFAAEGYKPEELERFAAPEYAALREAVARYMRFPPENGAAHANAVLSFGA